MSQIYNKMKIDVKEQINDIITAKQDDLNSRFLDVYLYDSGTAVDLTGHEVRIYMRKPDGTEVFNPGVITNAAAGRCQFELTSQALSVIGILKCEISIWKDNTEILTTQTFAVYVTESLRSESSVESSNEYGALVLLFQELYEFRDILAEAVHTFTLKGVTDLLGLTGDTGGSKTAGTVMAKLNALLASWTSTRAGYIDTIKGNTDTDNTANKTGKLSAKLAYIISMFESPTFLSGKIIKSVQRGTIQAQWNDGTGLFDSVTKKTISAVDINKSIINITTVHSGGGEGSMNLSLTSSTELTLNITHQKANGPVSYEIIEFY